MTDDANAAEIAAIRAALIAGEQSGMSDKTVEEIWEEAQQRYRAKQCVITLIQVSYESCFEVLVKYLSDLMTNATAIT